MTESPETLDYQAWQIAEILRPGYIQRGWADKSFYSIKRFLEKLDFSEVLEAAQLSFSKMPRNSVFPYFCGICWNKIRADE